jgi:ubiquinone biosynthesis protein Coq4
MALPILKLLREPEVFPYSKEQLMQMESGCMGRDLANFIEDKKLELLPYYARHDMKYILLGYDTTDEGEVCLQSFMLGNGHISFPVLATVLYGFITMPEYWIKFWKAFYKGKQSVSISNWKWNELMMIQTDVLKNKIFYYS